jgi:hypothetical protein
MAIPAMAPVDRLGEEEVAGVGVGDGAAEFVDAEVDDAVGELELDEVRATSDGKGSPGLSIRVEFLANCL